MYSATGQRKTSLPAPVILVHARSGAGANMAVFALKAGIATTNIPPITRVANRRSAN